MKTLLIAITTATALFIVSPAHAATFKYRNCAALNADYPHGVGRPGAVDKVRRSKDVPVTNFEVSRDLFNSLPKTLDRDKDGVACEKH